MNKKAIYKKLEDIRKDLEEIIAKGKKGDLTDTDLNRFGVLKAALNYQVQRLGYYTDYTPADNYHEDLAHEVLEQADKYVRDQRFKPVKIKESKVNKKIIESVM